MLRATGSGRSTSGASAAWGCSRRTSAPTTWIRTAPPACSSTAATWTRNGPSYGPNAKTYTEAFVEGVNAFVQEVRDGTRPAPAEFKIAGTQPDLWKPEDVVRIRSHGLTRNVASEVTRAQVACAAGLDADRLRTKFEPDWQTSVPAGLDPARSPRTC